jgi:hypothetical protein
MGKLYLILGAAVFLLMSVPAICSTETSIGDTLLTELRPVIATQNKIIVLLDDEKALFASGDAAVALR